MYGWMCRRNCCARRFPICYCSRWWKSQNLPISQFYHVSVDDKDPYRVYGGLQDNESWVGASAHPGGITNVYRLDLQTSRTYRLTDVPTGVSGITRLSPGLSVARNSPAVVFSVLQLNHLNGL